MKGRLRVCVQGNYCLSPVASSTQVGTLTEPKCVLGLWGRPG